MGFFNWLFGHNATSAPTNSKVVEPVALFNENNPHEIYDIVRALSTIVANVGDSWLTVVMQDENPTKGWPRVMRITANIDDWHYKNYRIEKTSFMKLGLSPRDAEYLASIPFSVNGDSLEYEFPMPFDEPSCYKRFVLDEMRNGVANSSYVKAGLRTVSITDKGFLQCKVD